MKLVERFSAVLALLAFLVVCVSGMIRGADPESILFRGVLAIIVFFIAGRICGQAARALMKENRSGKKGRLCRKEDAPFIPYSRSDEKQI